MALTVLHVDDDPSIREVVAMALRVVGGFELRSVESGEAAIDAMRASPAQVLLLDVMMPRMDGPQTLEALRAMPELPDFAVVFLTAKVLPAELERLAQLGAAAILTKPFRIRELVAALQAAAPAGGSVESG